MPNAEFGSSRGEPPHFDGTPLAAKYALLAGAELDAEQAYAWRRITAIVDRLRAARRVLISTPMWYLGIPYRLKHYIDLVTQPGLTFSFDPASGYTALLARRTVLVILASSGDFARGSSWVQAPVSGTLQFRGHYTKLVFCWLPPPPRTRGLTMFCTDRKCQPPLMTF